MALRHVKKYMYTMQNQYLQMKRDLQDFNQAFKAGYITQDQLQDAKRDVEQIQTNYHRLLYIMHLFEIPAKSAKEPAFRKANKEIIAAFAQFNADQAAVVDENKSVLDHLRSQLRKLSEGKDK